MENYTHNQTKWAGPGDLSFFLSLETQQIINIVNYNVISVLVSVAGVVSNALNIVVFIKMGFRDTTNISLLGLAIADLLGLLTIIWTGIAFNPLFEEAAKTFSPSQIVYMTGGVPRTACIRATSWITAFIALERCLCIIYPMKIKRIITRKRTTFVIAAIFLLMALSVSPVYAVTSFGFVFSDAKNKTVLGLIFADERGTADAISFGLGTVLIQSSFVIVVTCALCLIGSLRKQRKWRNESTSASVTDSGSNDKAGPADRDTKVTRIVTLISIIFIVCYAPAVVVLMAMATVPEFNKNKKYSDLLVMIASFSIACQAFNATINAVIYYQMSSKYRNMFKKLFSFG